MIELATTIKWHGSFVNGDTYSLGSLNIDVYKMRKKTGVEEYPKTIVIKIGNKHITDFVYTYRFKKMGNKGLAEALIENRHKIIMKIFI